MLPFDPIGEQTDPALADGLVEDLITRLAGWRWFPVIARNSTFTYKDTPVDVARVAREMGARYVVEGSVRRSGDRLRVTVQLLEGPTGHHVFAERFDRRMEDVFDVQDEIVDAVMGALARSDRGRARVVRRMVLLPRSRAACPATRAPCVRHATGPICRPA